MKKSLLIFACLFVGSFAFASISPKFNAGYELRSIRINTSTNESCLSLLKKDQMLFLNDGKVWLSAIDTATTELQKPVEFPALSKLAIHGTVAADTTRHLIYFSVVESKNCEWLYACSLDSAQCGPLERLVIDGMEEGREEGNFLANAGWSYYKRVRHVMQNPSLANDGNRLYFTSSTIAGGYGGKDLWCMDKKENGHWSTPINLGPTINTPSDEDFAFQEQDQDLYFSSNQSGICHLYVAHPADGWKQVRLLGKPYNSAVADYNMVVTQGVPFLISNRKVDAGSDIFAFYKLPCELSISKFQVLPDSVGMTYDLAGEVRFANAPQGSRLNFQWGDSTVVEENLAASPYTFYFSSLARPDSLQECQMQVNLTEECQASVDFQAPAMSYEQKKREFYWVFFLYDFDKDILDTEFSQELDSLAREMKKFPDAVFEVAGFTDSRGSETYNDRLSQRRATDILKLLVQAGIPEQMLKAVGYGERRLQVPNAQTEEEHAQNRRVEVRIINVDDQPSVVNSENK